MLVMMMRLIIVVIAILITANFGTPWIGAGMIVSPVLDASSTYLQNCPFQLDDENTTIVVNGSPMFMCGLRLSTYFATSVLIEGNLTDEYLLYIEDMEPIEDCPSNIYAIHGHYSQCSSLILHKNFGVNLQGNVSIAITEISNHQVDNMKCILIDEMIVKVNQTIPTCDVKKYDDIQTCDKPGNPFCGFTFPPNCNAALNYRDIRLNCEGANSPIYRLIVYPRHMDTLDLTGRGVVKIEIGTFRNLNRLKNLYLGINRIYPLHLGVFDGLAGLRYLSLKENNLDHLELGLFDGLKLLSVINLRGNVLKVLPPDIFRGLISLSTLLLGWNNLQSVDLFQFRDLKNLKQLELEDNNISTLPIGVFEPLIALQSLILWTNKLETVDKNIFKNMSNLRSLFLAYNELQTLDAQIFDGLRNLRQLYLMRNKFESFPEPIFHDFKLLIELHLRGNQITVLQARIFSGLRHLRVLGLAENNLTSLPQGLFKDLSELHVLGLEFNKLGNLPSGIFDGMFNLKSLYLDNNNLNHLENKLFLDCKKLDKLIIDGNKLKRIDFDIFINTPQLAVLDLSNNMLQTVPNLGGLNNLFLVNLKGNDLGAVTKSAFASINKTNLYFFVQQHEICECYVPFVVNCSASSVRSAFLTCYRLLSDKVLEVMMWVIGLNALGGNAFVLLSNTKHNKNKIQTFLCNNLALSDFLMGIYMIIIAIADVYYGDTFPMLAEGWRTGVICKAAGALAIASSESSVFFVTLISIDRLISVKYPRSWVKLERVSVKFTAASLWALSMILGTVPSVLAGRNPNFYDNSHVCIGLPLALYEHYTTYSVSKYFYQYRFLAIEISRSLPSGEQVGMHFSTAVFLGVNCACYVLIVVCYVSIIRTVYLSSKRAGLNSEMKTQIRLTLKVAAIVITDFMCWFPIILLGILVQSGVLTLPPSVFAWAVTFVLPINSAINPYLYTIADIVSNRRKENRERRMTQNAQQSINSTAHQQTKNTNLNSSVVKHSTASRNLTDMQMESFSGLQHSVNDTMPLPNVPNVTEFRNTAESNV